MPKKSSLEDKSAANLRANLARRKQQARDRRPDTAPKAEDQSSIEGDKSDPNQSN